MKKAGSCAAWCWVVYPTPCLVLLLGSLAGYMPGERLRLFAWIYGFPSTGLLLPPLSLVNDTLPNDFNCTCVVAGLCNGGILFLVASLVRGAMKPDAVRGSELPGGGIERPR
ncbi:MAG: hypothetical protein JWM88_2029 [Verrucomicrobia bacterium]|nr:hypothetical protein [Verrucomicrobiota bacterium]